MASHSRSSYARIVDTPAIIKILLLIAIVGCVLIGGIYAVARGFNDWTFLSLISAAGVCTILLFILNNGYYQVAGLGMFVILSFILTLNVSFGQAIFDEAMVAYPLLIVFAGLVFGKRSATLVTLITLAQIALLYLLAQSGRIIVFGGAIEVGLEETITTSVILGATGYLVWFVVDIIENAVQQIVKTESELDNAYHMTLEAWAKALEVRNREDAGHSKRVTHLSLEFAKKIGMEPEALKDLKLGALLHDIGKMGIPERILLKEEPLNQAEIEQLRKHTILAEEIIKEIEYLRGAKEIISSHHERFDGQGYPNQLVGSEIPFSAQLFALIDCWDVLRSDRPCRKRWPTQKVLDFIKDQSGKKFNPELVDAFIDFQREQSI